MTLQMLSVCVCVQIQAKKAQKGEARQQAAAEEKAGGQGAGLFSYINNMLGEIPAGLASHHPKAVRVCSSLTTIAPSGVLRSC